MRRAARKDVTVGESGMRAEQVLTDSMLRLDPCETTWRDRDSAAPLPGWIRVMEPCRSDHAFERVVENLGDFLEAPR